MVVSSLLHVVKIRHGVGSAEEPGLVAEKNQHDHVQHRQGLGRKDHTLLQQGFVRASPASVQKAVLDASPVATFCKQLY